MYRYVSYKDRKAFMNDLKTVYKANTAAMAEEQLEVVASPWKAKYPLVLKSWRANWLELSSYSRLASDKSSIVPLPLFHFKV